MSETTNSTSGGMDRLDRAIIPETTEEDRTSWGWFGDCPSSRREQGGLVATTKHETCLSCFYPIPAHRLIDGTCPDCRGDFERITSTEVNTDKRLTAKTIVKTCAACGTEKPILDLDDEGCCEGGCK